MFKLTWFFILIAVNSCLYMLWWFNTRMGRDGDRFVEVGRDEHPLLYIRRQPDKETFHSMHRLAGKCFT